MKKIKFLLIAGLLLNTAFFTKFVSGAEKVSEQKIGNPTRQPILKYQYPLSVPGLSVTTKKGFSSLSYPVDVVFAIDNTGSMGGVIGTVKADVPLIASSIRAQFSDTWFGSIKFRDYGDTFITQILTQPTSDINLFQSGINSMSASGGADWPEAYVEVVAQGVRDIVWRPGALHLLVIVGDAPPHDTVYGTGTSGSEMRWSEAASLSVNAGIVVSMVAVGGGIGDTTVYNSYNYMATSTGGLYVESSNPTEVTNALINLVNNLAKDKPTVVSTTPANGAVDVALNPVIKITFNTDMDATTFNVSSIYLDAGYYCVAFIPELISYDSSDRTLSLTLWEPLSKSTLYTVVLTDAIKSSKGISLSRYSWSFSTPGLTTREAVLSKLEGLRLTAKGTMQAHSRLVADYVYRGSSAMSQDQRVALGKFVADIIVSWDTGAGTVKLFGPGTKGITAGFRAAIEVARDLGSFNRLRKIYQIFITKKHWEQLSGIMPANAFDSPPTLEKCQELFDSNYKFYKFDGTNSETDPSFYGATGAIAEVDKIFDKARDSLPVEIDSGKATDAIDFLDSLDGKLKEARNSEVKVMVVEEDTCHLAPIGSITTWNSMLDWGIKNLGTEEGAKLTATLIKAAGAIIKVGGVGTSWTVLGLGAVAWGDILIWGPTGIEVGYEGVVAVTGGIYLSPIETIGYSVQESTAAFNDEILTQIDVLDNSTKYVVNSLVPPASTTTVMASLDSTPKLEASESDLVVKDINFAPLNVFESSQQIGYVTVLNSSSKTYRVSLIGSILGPPSDGNGIGRPVIGFLSQPHLTEIPLGETARLEVTYGAANTFIYGMEPFLIKASIYAIPESGYPSELGPYIADLWAGGNVELSVTSYVHTSTLLQGLVKPGDRQEIQFTVPSGVKRMLLTLCTKDGTSADLHLFAPDGNHVGFDYSAEIIDLKVSGARYSGPDAPTEFVELTSPPAGVYIAKVVGRSGPASFIVHKSEISAVPAVFATEPHLFAFGSAGQDVNSLIVMREAGGSNGVTGIGIICGDLLNEDRPDNIIPSDHIMIGDYPDNLLPSEQIAVPLKISIPLGAVPGRYLGNITLTSSVGSHVVKLILDANTSPPSQIQVKKCTVTAGNGKNDNKDSIALTGTIGVTPKDFSGTSEVKVNIGGAYSEAISVSSFVAKKGKYTYTHKIPKYGQGAITSLVIDTNKHTFSLKAQKIDLTGLHCPFDVEFDIGNYQGAGSVDEKIANGKGFIPVQLMTGVEDYLQVQSVKVKKGKLTDTLTAKGGIAYGIMPTSMSDIVLKIKDQTFTLPAVNFKPSGKSGLKYVCKNAKISEGGIANGTFDFGKCTFSISIKNTKINSASGPVDLTLTMGSFNEQVNFDLDTGQTIY